MVQSSFINLLPQARFNPLCLSHRTIEPILSTESARSLRRATATITRLSTNITDTVRALPFSSHTCDDWTLRAQVTYYCILVALSSCFNSERSEVYTWDGRVCMASLLISKTSCLCWHSDTNVTSSILCSKDVSRSDVPPQRKMVAILPHIIAFVILVCMASLGASKHCARLDTVNQPHRCQGCQSDVPPQRNMEATVLQHRWAWPQLKYFLWRLKSSPVLGRSLPWPLLLTQQWAKSKKKVQILHDTLGLKTSCMPFRSNRQVSFLVPWL